MKTQCISVLFVATWVSLFAASQAQAQGIFTPKGFGAEASFSSQENINTLSLEAGYALRGVAEFGLSVARASEDQNGLDVNATGFSPFIAAYPVRQSQSFPVSVRLGATYTFFSFGGDAIDEFKELGVDLSGSGYEVGGSLFRAFSLSQKVKLIPRAGISYVSATLKLRGEDDMGEVISEKETNGFALISLATSFAFQPSSGRVFTVTPRVGFSEGEAAFGISTGLVLPRR